ncbi:MAG: nitroreductase family protein [Caulobacteraceae bacterium]
MLPPEPEFGEALPPAPAPQVLAFLARRRSASALTLAEPGPSPAERADLIRLASRAPDHGKLFPWRFIIIEGEAKTAWLAALEAIAAERPDAAGARAKLAKFSAPPLTIAVVSRQPKEAMPEWEQRLSAGAAAMLLLLSAQAMGYGANWITDWCAYDEEAQRLLGLEGGEKIAAFVHIGTVAAPPLERARPDPRDLTTLWTPQRVR